jgi:hypothetical protein
VVKRTQKITFGEMRASGVRCVIVYCSDYMCSHAIPMDAANWPDTVRLSDIEDHFVCKACGRRGADVRPDFTDAPTPSRHTA